MTTPTRVSTETVNGDKFTIDRALFVTPRGSCGVRMIHRISGERVSRAVYEACLDAARREALQTQEG